VCKINVIYSYDAIVLVVGRCRAAVQIMEWIELERENLVSQLRLLRRVFSTQWRRGRGGAGGPPPQILACRKMFFLSEFQNTTFCAEYYSFSGL